MSDRNFSRRRRGGMRFRPSGGLGHGNAQRPDKDATQARAEVVGGTAAQEKLFEHRHAHEIERVAMFKQFFLRGGSADDFGTRLGGVLVGTLGVAVAESAAGAESHSAAASSGE